MTKTKLQRNNGTYTYVYKWPAKTQKAILHIVHGSKEHIGRYIPMIKYLNTKGITVYGSDLRGHGESALEQNDFGHIDSYKDIVDDLTKVNLLINEENPNEKITMYGHSMGSFILRYFLIENKNFDAIISGTNEQDIITTKVGLFIARMTKLFKGKRKENKMINNQSYKAYDKKIGKGKSWLSNDLSVEEAYNSDPLNQTKFTNESFIAMLSWLREIRKSKAFKNHKGRLLIAAGDKDPVGGQGKGPKKVFNKFKKQEADVEIKIYEGGHHEIHNDLNKKEVWQDYVDFIFKNEQGSKK